MDIRTLDLHEEQAYHLDDGSGLVALRVPGGWIYKFYEDMERTFDIQHAVFVPYSNEFG